MRHNSQIEVFPSLRAWKNVKKQSKDGTFNKTNKKYKWANPSLKGVSNRSKLVIFRIKRHVRLGVKTNLLQLASQINTTHHLPSQPLHSENDDDHRSDIHNHEDLRHRQTDTLRAVRSLVIGVAEAARRVNAVIHHADSVATADLAVRRVALYASLSFFASTLRTGVHRIQPERVVAVAVLIDIGLGGKRLSVWTADIDVQTVVVPPIEVISVVVVHNQSSGVVGVIYRLEESNRAKIP